MAAAAASSRLSRIFLTRQSQGRRPPKRSPNPIPSSSASPSLSPDTAVNPKDGGAGSSASNTSKTPVVNRRLSRAAISIFAERDLDRVVTAFKECSSSSRFRQTPRVFDVAVRRLAAAGRRDGVVEILEAQKAYPKEFSREGFSSRIISLYGTAGMPDHAVATYRQLPSLGCPQSTRCLNALLSALVGSGEHARALEVFREECPAVAPTVFTYNVLAEAAMKMGDLDTALGFLRKIQEEEMGSATIACNIILNGLTKSGLLLEAEKFWASMAEQGVEPDVWTFNARLRCLVAGGKLQEATDLLNEMTGNGVPPDEYSYTALIDACCKNGELHEAKKLFEEMTNKGCSPNQLTYLALVPRLCVAGELSLAVDMCAASMRNKSCVTVEVLLQVTDALVASGMLAEARNLLAKARSRSYYRNSLDILAKAEERAAEVVDE